MSTPDPNGTSLLDNGRLRLDLLQRIARRPRLYSGRKNSFWTDPYIAAHVLEAHLDPHTEDASRRPQQIGATVETIVEHCLHAGEPQSGEPRLLDLACGPGLYAEQFAARGFRVTGVDYSPASIEHAREQARSLGLQIDYVQADLTRTRFGGPYEVITCIYGEFCTLSETERHSLLERARKALAPGGLLVFDVFTEPYALRHHKSDEWHVSTTDGFWQEAPHLVLLRHFRYEGQVSVAQYTIVDEGGSWRTFRIWWRHFTRDQIVEMVEQHGFAVEACYGSLWGNAYDEDTEWIGVYARAIT